MVVLLIKSIPMRAFALVLVLALFAHSAAVAQGKDQEADKILKKVKVKVSGVDDIRATFSYTLENRSVKSDPISRRGDFKFKRNKYRLDFSDQSVICDGRTVWQYLKVENEVNVSDYDPQEGISFDRIFNVYQQDMNAKFERDENLRGEAVAKLTLVPKKPNADYFKIEMWISHKTDMPTKMVVWGRNGSVTTYELQNIHINNRLQDTDFVFNPKQYPGVSIIDLRY